MKVNSISYAKNMTPVGNKTDTVLNTEFSVLRIPSHKDNIHLIVKTYGEKELKRFGILECKTCARRKSTSKQSDSGDHRHGSSSVHICQECGRCYLDDGSIIQVTIGEHFYDPSVSLFEGMKIDQRL